MDVGSNVDTSRVGGKRNFGAALVLLLGAAGHGNGAHDGPALDDRQGAGSRHDATVARYHQTLEPGLTGHARQLLRRLLEAGRRVGLVHRDLHRDRASTVHASQRDHPAALVDHHRGHRDVELRGLRVRAPHHLDRLLSGDRHRLCGPPERGGDYPPCARGTQSAHFPLARIRPGRHSRAGRGERTPMDKTTDTLARYVTSLRYQDLSPRAVREAKRHLIDSLGCAMGGHGSEPAVIARRLAPEWNGASSARLLGVGRPTTPEAAAFANSVMIRFLDANDTYIAHGSGHPSDMLGALLAAAELGGASGQDLLLATIAGYEVFGALADQVPLRDRGWDQGVFVAPASAAGAGLLLGLSAVQLADAIAIAAQLAKAGMTGPTAAFEGRHGLCEQVTGPFEIGALAGRGRPFAIERTNFKFFAAEYHAQAPLAM